VDQALLKEIQAGFTSVGDLYNAVSSEPRSCRTHRLNQRQPISRRSAWPTIKA